MSIHSVDLKQESLGHSVGLTPRSHPKLLQHEFSGCAESSTPFIDGIGVRSGRQEMVTAFSGWVEGWNGSIKNDFPDGNLEK